MIDFSTIVRENGQAYVVGSSLQAVIDFLRGGTPAVIMLEARNYTIEQYPNETRALLQEQGLEPKF